MLSSAGILPALSSRAQPGRSVSPICTRGPLRPPAKCRRGRAECPRPPPSICGAEERSGSAQEFRRAHASFPFQLPFVEGKCILSATNDQSFLAAQNFSGFTIEGDNRHGKDFEILTTDFHERTGPRIERANFSLDRFG